MLSPNLAGSLPREFIQNWSDSISKVISLFDTEATRETTNQVLVNAFAAWRPSFCFLMLAPLKSALKINLKYCKHAWVKTILLESTSEFSKSHWKSHFATSRILD